VDAALAGELDEKRLNALVLDYFCSRRSWFAWLGVSALVRAVTAALFGVCEDI
jgi:hypothetical protein